MLRLFPKIEVSIVFTIAFVVFVVHLTCLSGRFVFSCSRPFPFLGSCFLEELMDSLSSSASTVPSLDEYFDHNMWTPLLELLFLEQFSCIFAFFVVEIYLTKIALSCHLCS